MIDSDSITTVGSTPAVLFFSDASGYRVSNADGRYYELAWLSKASRGRTWFHASFYVFYLASL